EDHPDDDFIVMLDPVGHPFCFVSHHEPVDGPVKEAVDGRPPVALRMPFLDCPDHNALVDFYQALLGGERIWNPDDEYAAVRSASGFVIGAQRVDVDLGPTCPTLERGQQLHMDMAVADRASAKARALPCRATVAFDPGEGAGHVVRRDP